MCTPGTRPYSTSRIHLHCVPDTVRHSQAEPHPSTWWETPPAFPIAPSPFRIRPQKPRRQQQPPPKRGSRTLEARRDLRAARRGCRDPGGRMRAQDACICKYVPAEKREGRICLEIPTVGKRSASFLLHPCGRTRISGYPAAVACSCSHIIMRTGVCTRRGGRCWSPCRQWQGY